MCEAVSIDNRFLDSVQKDREEIQNQIKIFKIEASRSCTLQYFTTHKNSIPITAEEIRSEILDLEDHMNAISSDTDVARQIEVIQAELDQIEPQLENLTESIASSEIELKNSRVEWEHQIDKCIREIDTKFAYYFKLMRCSGRIELKKDDDFSQWGIDILVSFRARNNARRLEMHSQSGGERSVTTMIYLLTLQNVTECPFRLVDEINQGMDEKNERVVFSLIVKACEELGESSPQYFVITPKLLPNLTYGPLVSVICPYNGPLVSARPSDFAFALTSKQRYKRPCPPPPLDARQYDDDASRARKRVRV